MSNGRPTLARQAYAEIRSKIVNGELAAGERLFPDALANDLSVSPTPVKEALALLEHDGLVTNTDRRASSVRRFTAADIREIYEGRILIELNALASGMAAGRADAAFKTNLEAIAKRQVALFPAASRAVLREVIALDRVFHEAIVSLGGNTLLSGWHGSIQLRLQTVRTYSIDNYDVARVRGEHQAILDALETGDAAAAGEALRLHLESSRDDLLARQPDQMPVR